MQPLTRRQREILDFLAEFIKHRGYAPSLEEIGRRFGLTVAGDGAQAPDEPRGKGVHPPRPEPQPLRRAGAHARRPPAPSSCRCSARSRPGAPIEAVAGSETIAVPEDIVAVRDTYYALRVSGNSMIDEQIRDGDVVIVKDRKSADNGEMVIALLDDADVTLKKFYRDSGRIRLQPANPELPPLVVNPDRVQIQGVVVGVMRRY